MSWLPSPASATAAKSARGKFRLADANAVALGFGAHELQILHHVCRLPAGA